MRSGRRTVSVGHLILEGMRIRTVLGPPLPHEIVRDTAAAIVLSMTHKEEPASARPDPRTAPASSPVPLWTRPQCGQDAQKR